MGIVKLIGSVIMAEATTPTPASVIGDVGTAVSALLTNLLSWMTSLANWVVGNPLALLFLSISFLMLAIHVIHSMIKFA